MRVGSLCTGYGGIDMAVQAVLGGELAWVCDIDPGASALLAHRHPDLPNHDDLTATDWSRIEPVDVMTGGWPCQPWSSAGRRKGIEDERAIWPAVAAAIRAVRPRLVVLENVSAIAGAGELARACGDLAEAGYVGSWRSVRASDVGAPHRRERIFIVAVATADAAHVRHKRCRDTRGRWARPEDCGASATADPASPGRRTQHGPFRGARSQPLGSEQTVPRGRDGAAPDTASAERGRPQQQDLGASSGPTAEPGERPSPADWAGYAPVINRWAAVVGRDAPAPTVLGKRGGRQLSPWFVEWMMGLPLGHVTDVPGLTRNQQLKLLGNGVVPQQADAALRLLLPRLADVQAGAA